MESTASTVTLLYASRSMQECVLRTELDALRAAFGDRLKITYHHDDQHGFLSDRIIRDAVPQPDDNTKVLVCGPPGMVRFVAGDKTDEFTQGPLGGVLKSLGYTSHQVHKF